MPAYTQPTAPVKDHLKIVELFETVQGEGAYIGVPSVFLRTGMCNLECAGCDTKWDKWDEMSIEEIAQRIYHWKSKHVVFTGGEPTLWQDGLYQMMKAIDDANPDPTTAYTYTVESNGAVPLRNNGLLDRADLWSFSPKVGSLGRDEVFKWDVVYENLRKTSFTNQLKYVVDPNIPEDMDRVFAFHEVAGQFVMDENVYFQPYDRGTLVNIYARQVAFNINEEYNNDLKKLTELVMERSGSRFRVVPQLHKYISWR